MSGAGGFVYVGPPHASNLQANATTEHRVAESVCASRCTGTRSAADCVPSGVTAVVMVRLVTRLHSCGEQLW
jgi:hypothetical protein